MKKKETNYKGLDTLDVFLDDSTPNSPEVFQITEFPTRLTAGKNLIKIKGHPTNLRLGSYLNIEVLDYNGNPIYTQILDYIDEDKSRVISIWIYEDTSPGEAIIYLVGELKELNNQPVPSEWAGKANVRWSRNVSVNPTLSNNSEILFENDPNVILTEQLGVQLNRTYLDDIQYPTMSTGSVKFYSLNGQPAVEISGNEFVKDMETGTITVDSPINPLPTPTYTPSSTSYTSQIKKVLSSNVALLEREFIVNSSQSINSHTYSNFDYSSYVLNYEVTPTYTATQNSESFAFMEIEGLCPGTGDINRIKVYTAGGGNIGVWELANDIELTEIELFTDTSSAFPDFGFGQFTSQNISDTYWTSSYYDGFVESVGPTLTWDTSSLADGLAIQDMPTTNNNQVATFQHKPQYTATFNSGSNYKITIDAIGSRTALSGNRNPQISIFLSGSAFTDDAVDTLNQEFPAKFGQRVGSHEVTSNSQRLDDVVFDFVAPKSGRANLIIVIEGGQWEFSDIRTTTDDDPGYTPNYSRIRTEIPTKHKSRNQLAFKVEYYNVDGVKSKFVSYIDKLDWTGGNRYIDGEYSMITGSLYIAHNLETGIAISGYENTGYVRSLGYAGFRYALDTGDSTGGPGFLLWSGSALADPALTLNDYSGVGLEMIANSDNYFQFRTETGSHPGGILAIHSEEVFIGTSTNYLEIIDGGLNLVGQGNSSIYIEDQIDGNTVVLIDTANKFLDAVNIGRVIYSNSGDYKGAFASQPTTFDTSSIATFYSYILPGENRITLQYSQTGSCSDANGAAYQIKLEPLFLTGSTGASDYMVLDGPDGPNNFVSTGSLDIGDFAWQVERFSPGIGVLDERRWSRTIDVSDLAGRYVKFDLTYHVRGISGLTTGYQFYSDIVVVASRSGVVHSAGNINQGNPPDLD